MATKKKEEVYTPKAVTTSIRFTSRASIKIGEKYYTVEACEERMIPDIPDIDINEERLALWDTVNEQCDDQIADIKKVYGI